MATHSRLVGYVLWLLLGMLGVHRFYFGKRTSGAAYVIATGAAAAGWHLQIQELTIGAAGVVGLALLVDLFLLPTMTREIAGRYQFGRYNYSTAWLLMLFAGVLGAHRFYIGKWGTGLLYLATLGLAGLGVLYDILTFNDVLSDANERWISGEPVPSGA